MSKTSEMIKKCIKESGMTQSDLARLVGVSPQRISQKLLCNNDMKYQDVVSWLDLLGYDVEIKKRQEE